MDPFPKRIVWNLFNKGVKKVMVKNGVGFYLRKNIEGLWAGIHKPEEFSKRVVTN
jgi:hypothetical protein